ncbi:choice-of-anchor D domain-containing protein [Geomonas sp. RF6]|uniref:choice-of-anchor D domain-containing protein n=1 Tax=Geomonas sp. RF6 TaxID=2897342 RepID=UPI001E478A92|nr:choice-of-anchor D domain-containing protein [Geomonas sp. RF6]UFS70219.1 choice-of-anchor D domain-containing protein [Geomonas sp. RF6]
MKRRSLICICLATVALAFTGAGPAGAAPPVTMPGSVPDYYETPNWANSPPLRKFVDTLPGLNVGNKNNLNQYIPVAIPDKTTYPGSDYYEIEVGQYTEQMHSDLDPTTLRGYRQTNTGDTTVSQFHYLGPLIVATKGTPVRVKFTNSLPTGSGGDLFLPVDPTIMGSGDGPLPEGCTPSEPGMPGTCEQYTRNRATLHLHGGRTPWISDGTPHQWITPKGETTSYPKGVSVQNVPDMWFDASGNTIASCAGALTCNVPGATNDPGAGSQTYYWTNDQSGRLMFYHDHSSGITRLNVYAGEAAGYLIQDAVEQDLVARNVIPGAANTIPLVIQDKTYVDDNPASPTYVRKTDPTWNWGTGALAATPNAMGVRERTPKKGDLWWPHVYMPAENPYNPDLSGMSSFGRWFYGPWFYPATPVCGQDGAALPLCIAQGPVANPYYDPACVPGPTTPFCQPPEIPGTPDVSWGAEAFLDTMVVNGTVYPTTTVKPEKYRLRILNAAHDRFLNLQLYQADPAQLPDPAVCPTCVINTEVKMLPAVLDQANPAAWPSNWPENLFDGREGGVPDPATRGPAFIQIGTEGGFLPGPVVLPNQPIAWNNDPTTFNFGNVDSGTLILAPAERADVIVDFSKYAGKTLILYNDAPTAFPALVPQYNYYTGAPDRTDVGGIAGTPVGMGPNVRTVMQIKVSGTGGAAPPDDFDPATLAALQAEFTATPTTQSAFQKGQEPIIVGQTAYNATYNTTFPATWPNWGISGINDTQLSYQQVDGTVVSKFPMKPKAIHDEMGASFDEYGRMAAKLGLELPKTNAGNANFLLQNYVDPPTEQVLPNGVQIWKISHNGVDAHPLHFHLFDVQLLNRVAWDGAIRLPDPNELGWKDTIRVNPLEDTIVALRPILPVVPFPLPDSIRPLNPAVPLGSAMGFSQTDPRDGGNLTGAAQITNQMYNFGHEYVWHCHILSHEENDFMRPMSLLVAPPAPSGLTAGNVGGKAIVTFTDNSANETGFVVQSSNDPTFTTVLSTQTVAPSAPSTSSGKTVSYSIDPPFGVYFRVQAVDEYSTVPAAYRPEWQAQATYSAWTANATVGAASGALASAAPSALAFGAQYVNTTSAPQQIRLSNIGDQTLDISAVALAGANSGDFAFTSTCGATVAAGGNCTFSVTARPTATGLRGASLVITSNSVAQPSLSLPLSATGVAAVASVAPGAVIFPIQQVLTTSPATTLTLSNTGTAALAVSGITFSGANAADFAQTNTCGTPVVAGGNCTVRVTFRPTATGIRTAQISIATNDPVNATASASLTGTGTGPVGSVSPSALAFGSVLVNTTGAPQTVTVTNSGSSAMTISSIALAGANSTEFSLAKTCGATLAAGASCTATVNFSPTSQGAKAAQLTIATDAPLNGGATSLQLPMSGLGTTVTLSSQALYFGPQILNSTSSTQVISILNTSTAPMTISNIAVSGSNAGDFTQTNNCPASLRSGQSCTINVRFAPTAVGTRVATMSITDSAAGSPQSVPLNGSGVQGPAASVTPGSINFGTVARGSTSAPGTITLASTGGVALNISGISLGGNSPGDFTLTNNNCPIGGAGLASGNSCTVSVAFKPTRRTGIRTATVSFTDNAGGNNSTQSVTLQGLAQ